MTVYPGATPVIVAVIIWVPVTILQCLFELLDLIVMLGTLIGIVGVVVGIPYLILKWMDRDRTDGDTIPAMSEEQAPSKNNNILPFPGVDVR